jgi:hypothetical protein
MRPLKVEEVLLLATLEQLVDASDATDQAVPRNDVYEALKPAACNEHDLIDKDGCVALGSDKDGDPDENRVTITDKGRKALREQGPKAIERARKDMAQWRDSPRTTPEMIQAQENVISRLEIHLGLGRSPKPSTAPTKRPTTASKPRPRPSAKPTPPQKETAATTSAAPSAGATPRPGTKGVRPPTAKP